jgi:hypothetical protein
MSRHFKISLILTLIGSLGLLYLYHFMASNIEARFPSKSKPLPTQDKEIVSYNQKTHILTVQTATKTIKEYAKNPEVEIGKNGSVKVDRHLAGFENEPFMGAGLMLGGPRFFLGDNVFHLSRFDVQASVGIPFSKQTSFIRLYGGFGYNFYSNTSINVSVNPIAAAQRVPDLAVFLSTRF